MMYDMKAFKTLGIWTVALLGLFQSTALMAQYPGFRPMKETTVFRKQFAVEARKISTITSRFEQEKNIDVLEEKIHSEGMFWFKREQKVRIEYQKPFQFLMILNQGTMRIRDEQKENTVSLKSNKMFQQINSVVLDAVGGTILDNADFTFRIFENEKSYLLEMTPASKGLKEFFSTILVYVDRADYAVHTLDLRETSGDNTVIRFIDKKLNADVQDHLFTVR